MSIPIIDNTPNFEEMLGQQLDIRMDAYEEGLETGQQMVLADIAEHDKNLIEKVCSRFMSLALDKSSNLFACKSIVSRDDVDTLIKNSADIVKRYFLKEMSTQAEGGVRT